MIKITVNSAVYEALNKAFPKPPNSAHRAITKYIAVLEQMLFKSLHFEATPMQRKLNLFTLSLQKLAQQGGQIGPNKIRVHKWLRENGFSLVEAVVVGSNMSGELSQCKLTNWVTMIDTLAIEDSILIGAKTNKEIDQHLSGDEFGNYQVFNLLYPEFKQRLKSSEITALFDFLPVDIASVKAYIVWLTTESKHITREQKDQALRQARIILAIASVMDGNYLQRKKPSEFGRMYYEGVSVQNINKELRRAVLGDCWEYDIRSSVVAWKMGWSVDYINAHRPGEDLRRVCAGTSVEAKARCDGYLMAAIDIERIRERNGRVAVRICPPEGLTLEQARASLKECSDLLDAPDVQAQMQAARQAAGPDPMMAMMLVRPPRAPRALQMPRIFSGSTFTMTRTSPGLCQG